MVTSAKLLLPRTSPRRDARATLGNEHFRNPGVGDGAFLISASTAIRRLGSRSSTARLDPGEKRLFPALVPGQPARRQNRQRLARERRHRAFARLPPLTGASALGPSVMGLLRSGRGAGHDASATLSLYMEYASI